MGLVFVIQTRVKPQVMHRLAEPLGMQKIVIVPPVPLQQSDLDYCNQVILMIALLLFPLLLPFKGTGGPLHERGSHPPSV